MGRRVKAFKINKKYTLIGVGVAMLALALVLVTLLSLAACRRNPLMTFIENSGITVKADGKTIKLGESYDLGHVQPNENYTATFSIVNSGNLELELTGDPLVEIVADSGTASMFSISPVPSSPIKARSSSDFTLNFQPVGVDGEKSIQLMIMNNSKQENFSFNLTSRVDGTPPAIKEISGVKQTYPAESDIDISTNVTVSATFSEALNPDTINTSSFTLTEDPDGAPTPVAAIVSYDPSTDTAFLSPLSLLSNTTEYEAVLSNTIEDLAGNTMALNQPWRFTTGVGITDSQPPIVTGTVPAQDATEVPLSSTISATFNEPIDDSTATTANFIVVGTTQVTGAVSYNDSTRTITFTPDSLDSLTTYTAQLGTGIKDVAGNPLTDPYPWTFTTEQGVDATGPTVAGRSPVLGASDVATNIVIIVEFDELIDPLTVTNSNFSLVQDVGPSPGAVSGSVSYNAFSKTAVFTPGSGLDNGAQYRIVLTSGIKDISQNSLVSQPLWTFTAGGSSDSTAPTVDSTNPISGGTGVLKYSNITATFSESMHPDTINNNTFTLYQGTNQIAGTVSYSEATKTATFNPTPVLDLTTVYTVTVVGGISGVKDAAGIPLVTSEVWTFTTEAGSTNPEVIEGTLNPPKNAENVGVDISTIEVEFDKMMDPATIDAATFLLSEDVTGTPVSATSISYNVTTRTATFSLGSSLNYSTRYKVECTDQMEDIGQNPLIDFSYKFKTIPNNLWDSMKWDEGRWAP